MGFRIIKGHLIKEQRGKRSLRQIADASGGQFTFGALSQWENGECKPTDPKVMPLLRALGCRYEDITEEPQDELMVA